MDVIGRRRHVLSLQEAVRSADEAGGAAVTWTERAQVFGGIEGLRGDESAVAMRAAGRTQFRVILRFRDDVAVGWRFVEAERVLSVKAVFDQDGMRRTLVCLCEEET